jgi:hypothetical protein
VGASGQPVHAALESWVGEPLRTEQPIDEMVLRYLAAFGPATVRDVQSWSGLTRLAEILDRLRPRLATFRDENGAELFDLPDAPRPDPHINAPARYLYDFDNLLLSHHDRSRVVTDSLRQQNFAPHGPVLRLVLLDGFTAAAWTFTTAQGKATLTVNPFAPLSASDREALTIEGGSLLDLLAPKTSHEIRLTAGLRTAFGLRRAGTPLRHEAAIGEIIQRYTVRANRASRPSAKNWASTCSDCPGMVGEELVPGRAVASGCGVDTGGVEDLSRPCWRRPCSPIRPARRGRAGSPSSRSRMRGVAPARGSQRRRSDGQDAGDRSSAGRPGCGASVGAWPG